MSVVSTITAPSAEFRLGRALSAPGARIELERTVQGDVSLAVWVWTDDGDAYLDTLDERGITGVTCAERVDGGLRCSISTLDLSMGPDLLGALRDTGLTLLAAAGDDRRWEFRVRAESAGDLSKFRQRAAEQAIPVDIKRTRADAAGLPVGASLTAVQRETLVAAYDHGYYSTPRTATLAVLGEEFDISPRAVSQRLRRGVGNLVEATLPVDE